MGTPGCTCALSDVPVVCSCNSAKNGPSLYKSHRWVGISGTRLVCIDQMTVTVGVNHLAQTCSKYALDRDLDLDLDLVMAVCNDLLSLGVVQVNTHAYCPDCPGLGSRVLTREVDTAHSMVASNVEGSQAFSRMKPEAFPFAGSCHVWHPLAGATLEPILSQ